MCIRDSPNTACVLNKFEQALFFYSVRYRSKEIEIFEDQLDAKAKAKAEDVVTQWFSQPRTKLDWDKIAVINDKVFYPRGAF